MTSATGSCAEARHDPQVLAFVWDTPLLFETGLNRQCDAVVFVEAPRKFAWGEYPEGWDRGRARPPGKISVAPRQEAEISDYVVNNTTGDADDTRGQVRQLFSRILSGTSRRPVAPVDFLGYYAASASRGSAGRIASKGLHWADFREETESRSRTPAAADVLISPHEITGTGVGRTAVTVRRRAP